MCHLSAKTLSTSLLLLCSDWRSNPVWLWFWQALFHERTLGLSLKVATRVSSLSRLFSSVSRQSWGRRASYISASWNFILDLVDICVFKMQRIFSIKENYKKCGIVTH